LSFKKKIITNSIQSIKFIYKALFTSADVTKVISSGSQLAVAYAAVPLPDSTIT
jgi:hypothetical protein